MPQVSLYVTDDQYRRVIPVAERSKETVPIVLGRVLRGVLRDAKLDQITAWAIEE